MDASTIISVASDYYGIQEQELKGDDRHIPVVKARHVAMFYCRQFTDLTTAEIGDYFNRGRPDVIHATKSVNNQCETDPCYRRQVEDVLILLKEKDESVSYEEVWGENDWMPGIFVKMDAITTLAS